jgi:SAM-dependent methyltransferase
MPYANPQLKHLSNEWPAHSAAPNTHQRVLDLVTRYLPGLAGTRIADLPCGAGAFSQRLGALGADVLPVDIAAVEPFLADAAKRVLADANHALPFGDAYFGALVTIEGIEHLENPSLFLRECARVVKPGSFIFLTTPNVDSYRSRRSVLFNGYHRYFRPFSDNDKDSGHLHPIDMVFMRGATQKAGLEIVEVTVNRGEKKNWMYEMLRRRLTRKLPLYMRGEVPFYGEVIIYVLRKASSL